MDKNEDMGTPFISVGGKEYNTVPFCLQSGSVAFTEMTGEPGLLFSAT
uniref:Uncharacterized protein n=1 Tax=Anguilla anguilla TaxID=7936 RepID=A0A0E9RNF9_ANGAN